MEKILAKIEERFGDIAYATERAKLATLAFALAMSDHLDWKQSKIGKAYSKAHPISKIEVIKRLKKGGRDGVGSSR